MWGKTVKWEENMKRALIALLFVSAVIGMAIPTTADLNITTGLNIDMLGTDGAAIPAIQPQQISGHIQNDDNLDALVVDATEKPVTGSVTNGNSKIAGDITADSVTGFVTSIDSKIIGEITANSVTGSVTNGNTKIIGDISYPDSTSTASPTPTTTSSPDPTPTPTATSPVDPTPIPNSTSDITSSISANVPGGSGGSSGCGGGAITRENLTNIKQHESKEIQVSTGAIVYRFTTLDIVKEAGFTARTDEECVMARAEVLKGRPTLATSDVPGAIYFNVWVGAPEYGNSSKIEAPYIVFSVPDEKNNEPVKLLMFKDSWMDLKTEKIGPGTYKAYTGGFGSFAITGTHTGLLRTSPEVSSQPAVSPTVTIIAESVSKKPVNLVLILVLLVALTVIVYLLGKSKIQK
jgi:PGF-pre-PGF domain-containing protein